MKSTMNTLMFAFCSALADKLHDNVGPGCKAVVIVQTPDGDIHVSGNVSIPVAAEVTYGAVDVLERQLLAAATPEGPVQ